MNEPRRPSPFNSNGCYDANMQMRVEGSVSFSAIPECQNRKVAILRDMVEGLERGQQQ